jgi:hypothetical protein
MKVRIKKTLESPMEMIEVGAVGQSDDLAGYSQATNTIYVPTADLERYEVTVSRKRRGGAIERNCE